MAKKKEENTLEENKTKKATKEVKEQNKKETNKKVENTKKTTEKKEIENKKNNELTDSEKVNNIIKKAKESGKITYGELATELTDANPDQIDKVFDAFEEMGIDLSKEELEDEEPDVEDLKEVEELKLDEITDTDYEGINVDDPVRMYLREIGRIPLLTYDQELDFSKRILEDY